MICRFNLRTDQLHPSIDLSGPFCEAESSSLNHTIKHVARSLTIGLRVHRRSRRHCADLCCIVCPIETASRRTSIQGQRLRSRTRRDLLQEPCPDSSQENGTVKISSCAELASDPSEELPNTLKVIERSAELDIEPDIILKVRKAIASPLCAKA